uniref:CWF19-like protein 2 n=1 Tax=Graphocephala atropunctata TaxID=36148 RepID=A0A1B6LZF2_9HEMI
MGKDKKKHKKKSSKHKKHKSTKHNSSCDESTCSDESEQEWVEVEQAPVPSTSSVHQVQEKETRARPEQGDWLTDTSIFACVSREDIRQSREKKKDKNEDNKYMLDRLGKTDRELNPYWKDGGSGLPSEQPVTAEGLRQAAVTVGDQGVAWLRKALQRAKEQAAEQRRSLEEVVAERWGSLEKLESMIAAAEEREQTVSKPRRNDYKPYINRGGKSQFKDDVRKNSSLNTEKDLYSNERHNRFKDHSQPGYLKNVSKGNYAKPDDSDDDSSDKDGMYQRYSSNDTKTSFNSSKNDQRKEDRIKKEKQYKLDSRKDKRVFAKPAISSEDSSDDKRRHKSRSYYGTNSRKNRSRSTSSSSDSNSDSEEKSNKRYERTKHDKTRSKEEVPTKRFIKPSGSDNENDKRSHKYYGQNKDYNPQKLSEKKSKRLFAKPPRDSEDDSPDSRSERIIEDKKVLSSSKSGWRKKAEPKSSEKLTSNSLESNISVHEENSIKKSIEPFSQKEEEIILTDKEMNEMAAKLVKAELLGNLELAEELKAKLGRARAARENKPRESGGKEEVVILTHTDSKGFTRPVSLGGPVEPTGGRRKGKKVETHSGGKRMRYFADDDKYSLQEMFQREKLNTVEDSNELFAKLASKGVGRDDSTRDMEDVFEETARVEESDGKQQVRDRQRAINESKRTARSLDNCQWCLESQQMLKHLIVAIGTTCYLCVPPHQSLTENHCLIVPTHHTPCATQLDEDVWKEIQDFRKSIVQMFLSQDEDVVFFESARGLGRFPHMVLNCVPMPKETGDLAPIYFKKAIQECEMEWSNNKKLVDLRGRDVRRAVPKGLPYFAVDFGLDSGFAHVIEDEKLFPPNFAQEIIGGMLDLDHTIWRKQRRETFEEQSKKVIKLTKLWTPFDYTKNK